MRVQVVPQGWVVGGGARVVGGGSVSVVGCGEGKFKIPNDFLCSGVAC